GGGVGVRGRLGAAAPRSLTRVAAGAGAFRCDYRQLGQGAFGLVEVGGGENDLRAAAQLVQAEPPGGIVLAEDGGEPVPFGISQQGPAASGRLTRAIHGSQVT